MDSSREIEERAGEWLARRESGHWSAEDEMCFQQWLNASTANRVAYLRLEGAWERASRLQALKGHTPSGTVPSPDKWRLSPFISDASLDRILQRAHERSAEHDAVISEDRSAVSAEKGDGIGTVERAPSVSRRTWIYRALGACLMLAAVGSSGWYLSTRGPYYQTPVGGLASVPMKDGSKVTLNTDSAIRLAVTERERKIELERGEAFFDVAKDPSRPFVVAAGNKRVIAVGTKFSVRRAGDDVQVFVTEGKVKLEDALVGSLSQNSPRPVAAAVAAPDASERSDVTETGNLAAPESSGMLLTAGAIARAGSSGVIVQQKSPHELEDHLSWRAGYLTFRDTALEDAVAEFNRYNERQILIQDPHIGAIRFSGKVRPTSFEGFVRLLEDAFQIRSESVDGRIVLTSARHQSAEG